jgi:hypothetical protein
MTEHSQVHHATEPDNFAVIQSLKEHQQVAERNSKPQHLRY